MTKKLRIALRGAFLTLCSAMCLSANAQGFTSTATNWGLPAGGETYSGTNYSFRELYHTNGAAYDLGSQAWSVMDMNGDSKLDLVVYNENQAAGDELVFSPNSNPYWKVYLGGTTGFSTSATNWALPAGGEKYNGTNYSFRELSHTNGAAYDLGSQAWSIMDMNGDGKPDLVVYNENQAAGDELVFTQGSTKYWKVYLSTGMGFSATATNWTLPAGGEIYNGTNYSFRELYHTNGAAYDLGSQAWSIMDMNGDAKPDMVIYNENQAAGDELVFTQGSTKYWKVYLNTGSAFSQTATNWTLPAGGEIYNGTNYSFRELSHTNGAAYDLGSQAWSIMDFNGDSRPDIVVYNENQAAGDELVFTQGSSKYWKVYLNTATGFSTTATNWTLPAGGEVYNGTNYSFRELYHTNGAAYDMGSQAWTVMDLNGDKKPELVVFNENLAAGDELVYGTGNNRYWKAFVNTGTAFSLAATNWSLPVGGEIYNNTNYSFREISHTNGAAYDLGSQAWTVLDMNGDNKLDLVVYNENQTAGDELVYGTGSNRYWKVFLNTSTLSAPPSPSHKAFSAYPNPVKDYVFVKADAAAIGSQFAIFDLNGKSVKTGSLFAETSAIDLSMLNSGIYFLKVDGGKTVKIIKE